MDLKKRIHQFYFNMTLNELRGVDHYRIYPNLTHNSLLYLDIIAYKENCTVSYLAKALRVSKSAVTIKINELMKQGLVVKIQSEEDKRINYLEVVSEVIEEYKVYDDILYDAIDKIDKKYSEEEKQIFCNILESLIQCYEKKDQ